jgi:hypothetical protein
MRRDHPDLALAVLRSVELDDVADESCVATSST